MKERIPWDIRISYTKQENSEGSEEMHKEKTLLDLHPAICERAIKLVDEGKSIKEAIEQAQKELEGVIECQKKS